MTKYIFFSQVFCGCQNVINGTDNVRSQGTVKIATLRGLFVLEGTAFRCFILEPVSDVPGLYVFGARSGQKFLSAWAETL